MAPRTSFFAETAALNAGGPETASPDSVAEVLLEACAPLDDEALRRLPALPDVAADAMMNRRREEECAADLLADLTADLLVVLFMA